MSKFIGGVAVVTLGICTVITMTSNLLLGAVMSFGMFLLALVAIEEELKWISFIGKLLL